jgi:hypothetical protein
MKSILISIILSTMAPIAFAGGAPSNESSGIDCYPTVEPQDMLEKGWHRLKSFERLNASRDAAAGKIKLQRFDTLSCVLYQDGEATEFQAGEWWWRRVGKETDA